MSNLAVPFDVTPLIAGGQLLTIYGHGVAAQDLPSSGDDGASIAYNDGFSFPTDNNKQVRVEIIEAPDFGELFVYEDTSFTYTTTVFTADQATYRLFVDGADLGTGIIQLITGDTAAISPALVPSGGSFFGAVVSEYQNAIIGELVPTAGSVLVAEVTPLAQGGGTTTANSVSAGGPNGSTTKPRPRPDASLQADEEANEQLLEARRTFIEQQVGREKEAKAAKAAQARVTALEAQLKAMVETHQRELNETRLREKKSRAIALLMTALVHADDDD
jgi:hypothetical protein